MRVNVGGVSLPQGLDPKVGNLYAGKGGRGDTSYWLVVAIKPSGGCVILGLDATGQVVSSASYNSHAMKDRPLLGVVRGIDTLSFEMESTEGGA